MACCKKSYAGLLLLIAVILGSFFKNLHPLAPTYRVKSNAEYYGPLTRNNLLDSAQRLLEGKIANAPESLAIRDGKLYTGTEDGRILEITNDKVKVITRIGGKDCVHDSRYNEKSCGHPLGVRFDKEGYLVVADVIKGIYKVDIKTGAVTTLVSSLTKVDGREIQFADDLAIAKTGEIYFSDAMDDDSIEYQWHFLYQFRATGRVLLYDPKTRETKSLLNRLYFSNGVELSPDEEFLLVSQTLDRNIIKYYLKGSKKGQAEVFVDNLPGMPDNIRLNERGTYWIGFAHPIDPQNPSLWERINCHLTRYFVYSAIEMVLDIITTVKNFLPLEIVNSLHHKVHELLTESHYQTKYGLVVEISATGEILRSLHAPKGTVNKISQVTEHKGMLYISSYANGFIAKMNLPKTESLVVKK